MSDSWAEMLAECVLPQGRRFHLYLYLCYTLVADVFKTEVAMEKEFVVSEVVLASSNLSQCRRDVRLPSGEGDTICGWKLSSTRGKVWDAKLKLYVC